MTRSLRDEWWADLSGDSLVWARLRVFEEGVCEVFDIDAQLHSFRSYAEAVLWLREDEYERVSVLMEEGELPVNLRIPVAVDEHQLLEQMRAPQPELRDFLDRRFYESLGADRSGVPCSEPNCPNGAIEQSVLCRIHHFERVIGRRYVAV